MLAIVGVALVVVAVVLLRSKGDTTAAESAPSASTAALATSAPTPVASAKTNDPAGKSAPKAVAKGPSAEFVAKPTPSAWLRMLGAEPKALDSADVQKKSVEMLIASDPDEETTQKVFDQLTHQAGSEGLDVLYAVLETEPASKSGERAAQLLYRVESLERASPALRVTLDIRRMNCTRKLERFPVAARDGDARTTRLLEKLRPPGCVIRKGACCFRDDANLERALAQIRERER
jgi:hypothetical protein